MTWPVRARTVLALALLALWAVSAHLASAGVGPADLRVLVAVVPLAAAAALLAWQSPWPRVASGAATFSGLAILALSWAWLRGHLPWLYYLQHLGAHLALAVWFARSLAPGRTPVVSAMAQMITRLPMSERKRRYTRGVTLAWALFFVGNALVSTLLFAWAPIEIWSVHANLLTGPLIALFFGLEMVVRAFVLPRAEHPSLKDVVRAWQARRAQPPHSSGHPS